MFMGRESSCEKSQAGKPLRIPVSSGPPANHQLPRFSNPIGLPAFKSFQGFGLMLMLPSCSTISCVKPRLPVSRHHAMGQPPRKPQILSSTQNAKSMMRMSDAATLLSEPPFFHYHCLSLMCFFRPFPLLRPFFGVYVFRPPTTLGDLA